jgi:hypothetical protein
MTFLNLSTSSFNTLSLSVAFLSPRTEERDENAKSRGTVRGFSPAVADLGATLLVDARTTVLEARGRRCTWEGTEGAGRVERGAIDFVKVVLETTVVAFLGGVGCGL